jgi:hypothetical protein
MKDVYVLIAGAALLGATQVDAAEPLNEAQMDAVTAGAAEDASEELLRISAKHQTASGRTVQVDGTVDLERVRSIDTASLLLRDGAQSNLQSLININAVQSSVNVLVNLNIMIDSQIADLRQLNLGPR